MFLEACCKAAMTSIGATLAAASQVIQPIVKLANEPKAKCGKRTTPPETGNIVPSSEKVRAMSMIITPPRTQEMIAAGPASWEASSAPNSQPEPMIEPTPANSSPVRPT
jgi:hypothetical protein